MKHRESHELRHTGGRALHIGIVLKKHPPRFRISHNGTEVSLRGGLLVKGWSHQEAATENGGNGEPAILGHGRVPRQRDRTGEANIFAKNHNRWIAGWAATSCKACRRRVLPGSIRCQGEAPEGWGNGMQSVACPRYSIRKLRPMMSFSGLAGRN